MTDIYTKEKRSKIMSKIHDKETKPEELVRKFLFSQGFRFRKNDKRFPGKPDIVLPKYHTVLFIHGCFWHGHEGCKYSTLPKTRTEFWRNKIEDNMIRDQRNIQKLEDQGWNVIVVWGCEINSENKREKRLQKLITEINTLEK